MARISSGSLTRASSRSSRSVSTVVLPDPAGACSNTERRGSDASSRARVSESPSAGPSIANRSPCSTIAGRKIELVEPLECAFRDPADADRVAEVAGARLGIENRPAGEKIAGQAFQSCEPLERAQRPGLARSHSGGLHAPDAR